MSAQHHVSIDTAQVKLPRRDSSVARAKLIVYCVFALLVAGAAATLVVRTLHGRALAESTTALARQYVKVVKPEAAAGGQPLTLPGTLQGAIESPLYARTTGYVRRWTKDIGSRVKKGEVLAEIDTPEVDQQLSQAIAARQQAASSLELAKSSSERWESLRKKDAVSQQELDERRSTFAQGRANFQATEANVRRLQQLGGFNRIVAPFDGVITRRNVEVGDLIDAGNGGAGKALFTIAQVDTLRVYVYVPQSYAPRIKVGDKVNVTQAEFPGQVFAGTIDRSAGAIDTATRTMQIEISLPNAEGKLMSGSYVQVALPVSNAANTLVVPTNVLLFRPQGTSVAVVDTNGVVKLHPVTLGKDFGATVEILSGAGLSDRLILNPPDSMADDDLVTVVQPEKKQSSQIAGKPKEK